MLRSYVRFSQVFPIGSPLVADVSRAILKVAESSKAKDLDLKYFKNKDETCPDPVTTPDPNPSTSSRQLGVDSFWLLFVVAFIMCLFTLGKFTFLFFKKNQVADLWKEFHRPDGDSYINNVEKCSCSPTQQTFGVRVAKGSPRLKHLLFADDTMFFCKFDVQSCQNLMLILSCLAERRRICLISSSTA